MGYKYLTNVSLRVIKKGKDYLDVFFKIVETVKKEFILIPYPQTDVRIIQNKPT